MGGVYSAWAGSGVAGMLWRGVAAAVCLLPPTVRFIAGRAVRLDQRAHVDVRHDVLDRVDVVRDALLAVRPALGSGDVAALAWGAVRWRKAA